jgi:hypothetical protein
VLARLDRVDGVGRAAANRGGTLLYVTAAEGAETELVAKTVAQALADHAPRRLPGADARRALDQEEWRDSTQIRELSAIEYRTLALRPVPFVTGTLALVGAVALVRRSLLRPLHGMAVGMLIALGIVHIALTPKAVPDLSDEVVWFAAAGVALVLLGLLNVVANRATGLDRVGRTLRHAANVGSTLFAAIAAVAVHEPQAYLGLSALVVLTATALCGKTARPTAGHD